MINKKWIEKTKDYKAFVGNPDHYDKIGRLVFSLLLKKGLFPEHKLLDIGCGSLRVGEYILRYLKTGMYFGIEPNRWLIDKRCEELKKDDEDILRNFVYNTDSKFDLQVFDQKFDFILCNSIFIHACKNEIEKVFYGVDKTLEDEGKFVFNYIQGKKDNEAEEWTYPSHICYTREYIEDCLDRWNLSWEIANVNYPGKQTFIIARRK